MICSLLLLWSVSSPVNTEALDQLMRAHFPADGPGAAVVVQQDGKTLLRAGYGMANLELGVPVKPEHVFRLGSITKQFTAAAVLLLVEDGKVKLSDTLDQYVPGHPHGDKITVEMLLAHTSGIPNYTDMPSFVDKMPLAQTHEQMIDRWRNKRLDFEPGQLWNYSNSAYYLAGVVIEEASGQRYGDFLMSRIFKPLGMDGTRYDRSNEVVPNRVTGYSWVNDRWENMRPLHMDQPGAAGSLMGTVDDLIAWSNAIDSGKILKPDSVANMFRARILPSGNSTEYGLGWGIRKARGKDTQQHAGGINGFNTQIMRVPGDNLVIAILANTTRIDVQRLSYRILAALDGQVWPTLTEATLTQEQKDRVTGVYHIEGTQSKRIVGLKDDALYSKRDDGRAFPMAGNGKGQFFWPNTGDDYAVFEEKDGKVSAMVVYRLDGTSERAVRGPEPEPKPKKSIVLSQEFLEELTAVYELTPAFKIRVFLDAGQLTLQATGQPPFRVEAESEKRFAVLGVPAAVSFVRDEDNAVTAMILHQGGMDQRLKRTELTDIAPTHTFAMTDAVFQSYAGTWKAKALIPFKIKIYKDGDRFMTRGGTDAPIELTPVTQNQFKVADSPVRLTFERNEDGDTIMKLHDDQAQQSISFIKE